MNFYASMSPEKRAATIFCFLVSIAVIVTAVATVKVRTLQHFSERVVEVDGPAYAAAHEVEARMLAAQMFLGRVYSAPTQMERRGNFGAYGREVALALADLEIIQAGQEETGAAGALIRDFHGAQQRWSQSARRLMIELESGMPEDAVAAHWDALVASFVFVRARAQRIAHSGMRPVVQEHQLQIGAVGNGAVLQIIATLGVGLAIGLLIIFAEFRLLGAQRRDQEKDNSYRDFDRRVQRAFLLVDSENDVLNLASEVIDHALEGDTQAELMLSNVDSKEMKRMASRATGEDWKGCPVSTLDDCPTVQSNSRMQFKSNRAFEACPHFKKHDGDSCSATCVPLSVMGRTVGVVHIVTPENELPDNHAMRKLEAITRKAGDRIGLARALMSKDEAANTDMLTGLSNRRALEVALPRITAEHGSYAVAYGDLDHFKRLNDDHGHDTGDRALRLFAQVLRNSLRPTDLICRWGGEEFVIVFPGSSANASHAALERVRTRLRDLVKVSPTPEFTTSFGVSDSTMAEAFEDVLHRADAALLSAKKAGRDRVIIDDAEHAVLDSGEVDARLAADESSESADHVALSRTA